MIARLALVAGAMLLAVWLLAATAAGLGDAGADRLADRGMRSTVTSLQERLETELRLGLALSDDDRVQQLLEDEVARTPWLLGLEIASPRGASLFNSDRGLLGQPVPDMWLKEMATHPQGWVVARSESRTLGLPLRDGSGEVAAWLVPTFRHAVPDEPALSALPWIAAIALSLALALHGLHERRAARRLRAELALLRAPAGGCGSGPLAAAARRIEEARDAMTLASTRARAIAEDDA